MLPENIKVVDLQKGGTILDSDTDSIMLPENIKVVDLQKGGSILDNISSETELEFPN